MFVASDRTAVGVLRAFHEQALRVPDDVAVASFDGSWEGQYTWPSLTTVRQPIQAMASAAVDRLLNWRGETPHHETFSGDLVVRESCGPHDSSVHSTNQK
ncbi:hypothetical protein GCM10025867_01600 [Frondihabitans sucicola]|uniref:Transcriptional regulator LacI/GalR-like sensor domain-containing protein n=1 Tax=Frondihabitans sucicola TaxID=1268041 RepID=A0ABM8GHS3_9MICO|nr:hypothetical protein GCM10025867_01600 [Frondihabitans sucicola]